MLTIFDIYGDERFSTPINIGSKRVFKLMGDDYITLKFSIERCINFVLGDYCDVPGFGRFELVSPYWPTYNKETGGYDYELRLDAQHIKWRNKISRYLPLSGGSECSYTITATPLVHLQHIVDNVNALANVDKRAYLYNGTDKWVCSPGPALENSTKTIQYDKQNILDALNTLAEQYEVDWWVDNNVVYLGKCERDNSYIDFELGVNLADMTRSGSTENLVTRIVPFGSERNLSAKYRKDLIFTADEVSSQEEWDEGRPCMVRDAFRFINAGWFKQYSTDDKSITAQDYKQFRHNFRVGSDAIRKKVTGGDPVAFSQEFPLGMTRAGTYEIDFADFDLWVAFDNRTGSVNRAKVKFRLDARPDAIPPDAPTLMPDEKTPTEFADKITDTTFEYEVYVPGIRTDAHFVFPKKEFFPVKVEYCNLTLTVEVSAIFDSPNSGGSVVLGIGCNAMPIHITHEFPNVRYANLALEVLDNKGNVSRVIENCIYNNAQFTDIQSQSWITLPARPADYQDGTADELNYRIFKGERYRIPALDMAKVKSSYFTNKYKSSDGISDVRANGVVNKRLMLPESYGKTYIDCAGNKSEAEAVEDVVIFEDVFPKSEYMVTRFTTKKGYEKVENDDRTSSYREFDIYTIDDNFFSASRPFKTEYRVPGTPLEIHFKDGKRYKEGDTGPDGQPIPKDMVGKLIHAGSGMMNGLSFEVNPVKRTDGSPAWEIIRKSDSDLPNELYHPVEGDMFVLVGFDAAALNPELERAAEEELLDTARRYIAKLNTDPSTYECTLFSDVAYEQMRLLSLGTRVNLINDVYIKPTIDEEGRKWGRKSRIIGYELNLDIPYDSPVYTIGEKPQYSRFGQIEDRLDAITYAMSRPSVTYAPELTEMLSSSGGAAPIYIVKQNDVTPASDTNVFSALRSVFTFASKRVSETIDYLWSFTKGITVGKSQYGGPGATITEAGNAEFGNSEVRGELKVGDKLTVGNFRPDAIGGAMWTDEYGNVHVETDFIKARKKLEAREVEIQELTHVGGCQIISPAAMRCSDVQVIQDARRVVIAYKCFFEGETSEGIKVNNQFVVGDLARCETFNIEQQSDGMLANRYYWRKVIGVSGADADKPYIILSNRKGEYDPAGTTAPASGDSIVTMGNSDPAQADRANVIILSAYGGGSPYIYQYKGINTFSLTADNLKTAISPNGNLFSGTLVIEANGKSVDVNTRLTQTENAVEISSGRIDLNEEEVANLKVGAEAIESRVNDVDEKNNTRYSEIKQTANAIGLKVDEALKGENLITGQDTGAGWEVLTNAIGSDGTITPTDGVFSFSTSLGGYLRTPRFSLLPGVRYSLSLNHTYSRNTPANIVVAVKYGTDTKHIEFRKATSPTGGIADFIFDGPATAVDDAFLEISCSSSAFGRLSVSNVRLSLGVTAHNLLATGIDIERKKITLTSDSVEFRNNQGKTSMLINADGKIEAGLIDADKITARRVVAGDTAGQRVEIDPDFKRIDIYDANSSLRTRLDGSTYDASNARLFGEAPLPLGPVAGTKAGIVRGSRKLEYGAEATGNVDKTIVTDWLATDGPYKVEISSGSIFCYAYSKGYVTPEGTKESPAHNSIARAHLVLDVCYGDNTSVFSPITLLEIQSSANAYDNEPVLGTNEKLEAITLTDTPNSLIPLTLVELKSACRFRLRLVVTLRVEAEGGIAHVWWGATDATTRGPKGPDICGRYFAVDYLSRYFSNGLSLGSSPDCYVNAVHDSASGMNVEAVSNGNGFSLSKSGLRYKHHNGNWLAVPKLVWRGVLITTDKGLKIDRAGDAGVVQYGAETSFNNAYPTLTDPIEYSTQQYIQVLNFPYSWCDLGVNMSNLCPRITPLNDCAQTLFITEVSNTNIRFAADKYVVKHEVGGGAYYVKHGARPGNITGANPSGVEHITEWELTPEVRAKATPSATLKIKHLVELYIM